ncbi:MAG: hypothetical protein M1401_12960 [Chloroflexi bacterium]|nr:hypothetical protein [Chloroflexota bacterium]
MSFGPEFPFLVLFAPAERPTICFEPYSCLTDAPNMAEAGQDAGLVILKPGATWQGRVTFQVTDTTEQAGTGA